MLDEEDWELLEVERPVPFPRDHIDDKSVPDRMRCNITLQVMEDPASKFSRRHPSRAFNHAIGAYMMLFYP